MSEHGDSASRGAAEPGTVEVTRAVCAPPAQVWEALTSPDALGQWFGTLTSPIAVGEATRLEFGDGDFFVLDVTRTEPPETLQYVWRFLAIGPPDTVTWRITPQKHGSLITVTDRERGRTREAAALLRKGWLDFTERLGEFLHTGKATRYAWRHELDLGVELPGDAEGVWSLLLGSEVRPLWLPLDGPALGDGARLVFAEGTAAARLRDVEVEAPRHLRFKLAREDWLHPTTFDLDLCQRAHDVLLTVSHNGWEAISSDDEYQRRQRMHFCNLWVNSLARFTFEFVNRQEVETISPAELRSRLNQPRLSVFDCNPRSHWARGHLPGATYVGQGAFTPELLPRDKSASLVFYCAGPW